MTEFIEMLTACQTKVNSARKELSEQITQYRIQIQESEEYLKSPFLWFSAIYFETANLILSFTDFQASTFYDFLVTMLRGNTELQGFFQLVRNRTSLKDLEWEQLQYACSRFRMPLNDEQYNLLKNLNSYVSQAGINGLIHFKVINYIKEHLKTEKKTNDMIQLLTILDTQWKFWFYQPAFGLRNYYLQLKLNDSTLLADIIDLHDDANTTLCNSRLFQLKEDPQSYTGYLVIPTQSSKQLYDYFNQCKQNEIIIEFELTEIINTRRSSSLSLYNRDKGWIELSEKEQLHLIDSLKIQHPRKKRKKLENLCVTDPFNHEWCYTHHSNPTQVISLFIKMSHAFLIDELPFRNIEKLKSLDTDLEMLNDLLSNQTFQVSFTINRLIYEFSLDFYLIEIPLIPFKQLSLFLNVLPLTYIFYTESKIYLWAYLNSNEVDWVLNKLNWKIKGFHLDQSFLPLDREWFDFEKLVWYQPKILNQ